MIKISYNLKGFFKFLRIAFIPFLIIISCESELNSEKKEGSVIDNFQWVKKEDFPGTPRVGTFHFSFNKEGYVGMGFDTFGNPLSDCWKYNSTKKEWIRIKDFPGKPRGIPVTFFIDNILYVGMGTIKPVGSDTNLNDFWKYNPQNAEWSQLKDFPDISITNGINVTINKEGYLFGGLINKKRFIRSVWKYNPVNDTWIKLKDMPKNGNGRAFGTGFSIGDLAYVGLGTDESQNFNDFWVYNAFDDTWEKVSDFTISARIGALGISHNGKGYILMGRNSDTKVSYNEIWKYNGINKNWSALPILPIDDYLSDPAKFIIGNELYLISGKNKGKNSSSFWSLNLE